MKLTYIFGINKDNLFEKFEKESKKNKKQKQFLAEESDPWGNEENNN